jgi:hypothetical protein
VLFEDDPVPRDCKNPSLSTLFGSFLRMGVTAFGGPAMIPYVRKMAVGQQKWLDGDSFQDGAALCQTTGELHSELLTSGNSHSHLSDFADLTGPELIHKTHIRSGVLQLSLVEL